MDVKAVGPSVQIGFIIIAALSWLACFAALITPGWDFSLPDAAEVFLAVFVHALIVGLPMPLFYLSLRLFAAERDFLVRRPAYIVAVLLCITPVLFIFVRYVIPAIYRVLFGGTH